MKLTQTIVLWGVAQPWGHRFVVGPAWGWVLVFYVLLGLAALAATKRLGAGCNRPMPAGSKQRPLVAAGGLDRARLVARRTSRRGPRTLEAEFLAVGHGLAVLIQTPDGQTFLYDCGRLGDPTVGRRIIAPALWARGVSRIDTVFLSHADQDHYDGLPDLLDRFPIGEVRIPPGFAGRGQSPGDRSSSSKFGHAASRSSRSRRPSPGKRPAFGSRSRTPRPAGTRRHPTTPAASCSTSPSPGATCS